MGLITTLIGIAGSTVLDKLGGSVGTKVVDAFNKYLSPSDKLGEDATGEQLVEAYYSKLTPEQRMNLETETRKLDIQYEEVNVELHKVLAEADKGSISSRKWTSLIMAIIIMVVTFAMLYIVFRISVASNTLPELEYFFSLLVVPTIILLLHFGLSGNNVKQIISSIKPAVKDDRSLIEKVLTKK